MKISLSSYESFDDFVRDNKKLLFSEIEVIYNLVAPGYPEDPILIYTSEHVFRVYINDLVVKFDIFVKQFFLSKLEDNYIFRENEKEINYIYLPEPYKANCSITNIEIMDGVDSYDKIVISLSNGKKACLCPSELVIGMMESWIE